MTLLNYNIKSGTLGQQSQELLIPEERIMNLIKLDLPVPRG